VLKLANQLEDKTRQKKHSIKGRNDIRPTMKKQNKTKTRNQHAKETQKRKVNQYHSCKWSDVDLCSSTTLTSSQPWKNTLNGPAGLRGAGQDACPEAGKEHTGSPHPSYRCRLEFVVSRGLVESGREFFAKGSGATKNDWQQEELKQRRGLRNIAVLVDAKLRWHRLAEVTVKLQWWPMANGWLRCPSCGRRNRRGG